MDKICILVTTSILINVEDAIEEAKKAGKAKKKTSRNQQILGSLRAGWSAKKVADEYRLSYSWAKKLCKRFLEGESSERKPGSGRPRKTSIREYRFLITEATRERNPLDVCPSVADLSKSLKERTSTQISPRTVQRRLHEKNFKKFQVQNQEAIC